MEKEFHIVKSELSALKKKFEQIERELQLKEKDGQNISKPITSDNLPQLNKQINTYVYNWNNKSFIITYIIFLFIIYYIKNIKLLNKK